MHWQGKKEKKSIQIGDDEGCDLLKESRPAEEQGQKRKTRSEKKMVAFGIASECDSDTFCACVWPMVGRVLIWHW